MSFLIGIGVFFVKAVLFMIGLMVAIWTIGFFLSFVVVVFKAFYAVLSDAGKFICNGVSEGENVGTIALWFIIMSYLIVWLFHHFGGMAQ